ncbi:hypothetical protein ACLOJK_026479 [Asimina triloba]
MVSVDPRGVLSKKVLSGNLVRYYSFLRLNSSKKDVEKFDERINFGLWQVQVKNVLIQSDLHKALKSRPTPEVNKQELEQVRQVTPSQQMEMLSRKEHSVSLHRNERTSMVCNSIQ